MEWLGTFAQYCILIHMLPVFSCVLFWASLPPPVSWSSPVSCYLYVSIPLSLDYKKPWFVAVLLPVLFQFIFFSVKSLLSQTFGLLLLLASLGFVFGDQLLKLAFCRGLCLPLSTLCIHNTAIHTVFLLLYLSTVKTLLLHIHVHT